jgi:ABC-type nitrate/sulfonate/bicarbonate transport system permease component
MRNTIPATLLLLLATVGWEAVVRVQQVPSYLVPPPSVVALRWLREPTFFLSEGGVSLAEALAGLAVRARLVRPLFIGDITRSARLALSAAAPS